MYRNLADSEAVRTALRIRARAGGVDGGDVGGGGGSLSSDPGAGSSPSDAEWDRRDVVTRVLLPLLKSLADAVGGGKGTAEEQQHQQKTVESYRSRITPTSPPNWS